MPDHWHALIWAGGSLTISQVIHDVKKTSAWKLHERRGTEGPLW
jgi:Transposase IS200 like